MPCQVSKLSHAFCVQGGNEWAMWAYGDNCPVEEMLMPGFFNPANTLLRTGDLLLMGSVPLPKRSEEVCRSDGGRKLLAMVAGIEKAQVKLRVLIDLGGPQDPDLVQGAGLAAMVQGMMGMGGAVAGR
jgi:hypothetical protein